MSDSTAARGRRLDIRMDARPARWCAAGPERADPSIAGFPNTSVGRARMRPEAIPVSLH
jgi:hypothetical protein